MTTGDALESLDSLRSIYRPPSKRAASKVFDRISDAAAAFIASSPLAFLATTDGQSVDVSPRGGPPGFAATLGDRQLAVPDLSGNNRLDSYQNLLQQSAVALLFVVPGKPETLRVCGQGYITDSPHHLARFSSLFREPKTALLVDVEEVFGHCAKAFKRARLWQPDTWGEMDSAPDLAELYSSQFDGFPTEKGVCSFFGQYVAVQTAESGRGGPVGGG